jgi:hypothetical protein
MLVVLNPLNAELNPICHLLALLGSANIVVVSRLRVKLKKVQSDESDHRILIQRNYMQFILLLTCTGMRRITTFRSTTDQIFDGGPIIL